MTAKLEGKPNRKARFRTVIALIRGEEEMLLEGICPGKIAEQKSGDGGFGYDPVFIPDGYEDTFAILGDEIKSKISHRAVATQKLIACLKGL
ncbi:MAG: non-canonical purine NTP pyrophosphatase [Saprospiraceae bacterium]